MKAFLEELADKVVAQFGFDFENVKFVFPNRRAGLFFRYYLSKLNDKPFFSPRITTINDYISSYSSLKMAEPLELLFCLYRCNQSVLNRAETFDEFYYWGEVLLGDFDDVDKYLVDAKMLYANILEIKEIDALFNYLTDEQIAVIKRFWAGFEPETDGIRKDFLNTWHTIYLLYDAFTKQLTDKGIAYEGMIYRDAVNNIKLNGTGLTDGDIVIFAGLNALTSAEREVLSVVSKTGKALFVWDYCSDFILDSQNKAGRFMQDNLAGFGAWYTPEKVQRLPQFTLSAAATDMAQTRVASHYLSKYENADIETAVVLADEALLMPVLFGLPEQVNQINITMGYPVKSSAAYALVENLCELQRHIRYENEVLFFYHKNVFSILRHPTVYKLQPTEIESIINKSIAENRSFISSLVLSEPGNFSVIFGHACNGGNLISWLLTVLQLVLGSGSDDNLDQLPENEALEREFLWAIYDRLHKLNDLLLKGEDIEAGLQVMHKIVRRNLESLKVPFSGEPLGGLQLMGILETRAVDFKNLLILSLNEGTLPSAMPANSFIPMNLRQGFGLPGIEHQDAMYAYYFYRLIQRAENVHLIYNASSEGIKSGEPSRYVFQLKYGYRVHAEQFNPTFKVMPALVEPIIVRKTQKVLDTLNQFKVEGGRVFSASALNTYIDCPLKFYFEKIEKAKISDELTEDVDARLFGNAFHKTMELLYTPFAGRMVTSEDLEQLLKARFKIEDAVNKALSEVITGQTGTAVALRGRWLIVKEVMLDYAVFMLKKDKEIAPFDLLGLEDENKYAFNFNGKDRVNLYGIIDRVHQKENTVYLVDYKSGKRKSGKPDDLNTLFVSSAKRQSHWFQVLFYALIYSDKRKNAEIAPELYYLPELFTNFDPKVVLPESGGSAIITGNVFEKYQILLKNLLSELFDPAVSFVQTNDYTLCERCDYRSICQR